MSESQALFSVLKQTADAGVVDAIKDLVIAEHSGREVVNQLQHLAREQGTTVLVVTHDPRIEDIADRIIHLEDGRLTGNGKAVVEAAAER